MFRLRFRFVKRIFTAFQGKLLSPSEAGTERNDRLLRLCRQCPVAEQEQRMLFLTGRRYSLIFFPGCRHRGRMTFCADLSGVLSTIVFALLSLGPTIAALVHLHFRGRATSGDVIGPSFPRMRPAAFARARRQARIPLMGHRLFFFLHSVEGSASCVIHFSNGRDPPACRHAETFFLRAFALGWNR